MNQPKIPKILSTMQDIQNPQTTILKNEMKKFMIDIQQQFDNVIGSYEKQLSRLEKQKTKIYERKSQSKSKTFNNNNSTGLYNSINYDTNRKVSIKNIDHSNEIDDIEKWMLPLNSNDFNMSTSSPFYRTARRQSKDFTSPWWGSAIKIRDSSPVGMRKGLSFSMRHNENQSSNNKINLASTHASNKHNHNQSILQPSINPHQRSQYQRKSQIKKQRQQEIVHCLQSHKKNLNEITHKMMNMVGRVGQQHQRLQEDQQNDQQQISSQIYSKNNKNNKSNTFMLRQQQDQHNRSLSNICDSLDNSFISQQTRKTKLKKKLLEEEIKKKNNQKEIKNQQIRKQRAIKNLLSRLRENAMSVQAPQQTVKGSKLLSVGVNNNFVGTSNKSIPVQGVSRFPVRRNSKVLINPVPVNSPLKSRQYQQQSPSFIEKRPTSILKQSSNILTRSISGISAIAFDQ